MKNLVELIQTAEGNPGAISFLTTLITMEDKPLAILIIRKLISFNLRGSSLYILYNDLAGRDMEKVLDIFTYCPKKVVLDACSRQDRSGIELIKPYISDEHKRNVH